MNRLRLVAALLLWAAAQSYTQTATATVTGTVADSQSALIVGAEIVIRNVATGLARTATSAQDGSYTVPSLPPGEYEVGASMGGFRSELRKNVVLQVDQQVRLDFVLQVGNTSEQVTVEAIASQVQTETASLGQVVNNKTITDLPLNGRQFLQLASLAPGVATSVSYNARQPGMRGALSNISVNGTRPEFNNYLLDGLTNVDGNYNLMVTSPSVDTVQEFKIQTSTYSAEFGRSVGAQINAVTKSGSNAFHGSAYEFLRNDLFDARNYFALPNQKKPPYRQNQFGASLGGPVWVPKLYNGRNRSFFFFNYEGLRIRQAQTAVSSVPTAAMRNGDLSQLGRPLYDPATTRTNPAGSGFVRDLFPNSTIPANRIDPIAKQLLSYWPMPNNGTGLVNNYVDNRGRSLDSNQMTVRFDQVLSVQDNFSARYIFTDEQDRSPGAMPGFGAVGSARPQNLALTWNRVISSGLLNEFKAGFIRSKVTDFSERAGTEDVATKLGISGLSPDPRAWGVPSLTIQDISGVGDRTPNDQANNTFQWIDNLNWIRGAHTFKFGAEVRRFQLNLYSLPAAAQFTFDGQYTKNLQTNRDGSGFSDFLLGFPRRADRNVGDTQAYFRRTSYAFYIQDDWKVTRRLTLNMGVRYELATPFYEKTDKMVNGVLDPGAGGITLVRAGTGDPYEGFPGARFEPRIKYVRDGRFGGRGVTQMDTNNWGPRFGFAWDPTGNQLWAVRGGFGVFFSEDFANPYFDLVRNPPTAIRQAIDANPSVPDLTLARSFGEPGGLLSIPRIQAIDPRLVSPYIMQWSLNVQRQLPGQLVMEVGYSGSGGHKISAYQILNTAPPAAGSVQDRRVPSPELGTVTPLAPLVNSNYHSGRLRLEKRMSRGLQFISAYTWSKAIDDGTTRAGSVGPDFAQNEARRDLERALSDYDVRHIFRFGGTYDIPSLKRARLLLGDWQIGGIWSAYSGSWLTVASTGNANTGVGNLRANVVPGVDWRLPSDERSPLRWFNTAAFAVPPAYTFGNSGRNVVETPGFSGLDLSVLKNIRIAEGHQLQFRAEMFNAPNHPNFGRPNRTVGSTGFGAINSMAGTARQIQFALKYLF